MKKQKSPLSIKILFWLSTISFWLMSIITVVVIVENAIILFGNYSHEFQMIINLPVPIEVVETGVLHLDNGDFNVKIENAYGRLRFVDAPMFVTKKVIQLVLFFILIGWFITWKFRNFMKNIKNGRYFEIANINNLKHISYGLVMLYVTTRVYMGIMKNVVEKSLEFSSVTVGGDMYDTDVIIYAALMLWVLAHIFVKGIELKQEQELTI
tara:strand:+ start:24444 stop:25073 length:630 start_codon:yes stop_codon:yes gene_type:complete